MGFEVCFSLLSFKQNPWSSHISGYNSCSKEGDRFRLVWHTVTRGSVWNSAARSNTSKFEVQTKWNRLFGLNSNGTLLMAFLKILKLHIRKFFIWPCDKIPFRKYESIANEPFSEFWPSIIFGRFSMLFVQISKKSENKGVSREWFSMILPFGILVRIRNKTCMYSHISHTVRLECTK